MSLCSNCVDDFVALFEGVDYELVPVENTVIYEWGMACPVCGRDDKLQVSLKVWSRLSIEGTDPCGDHEWDPKSGCACDNCGWGGTVNDATVAE